MIEITEGKNNTFHFELKTPNGNTLLSSVAFASREDIELTVGKLSSFSQKQSAFERRTDHDGKFLFKLKDLNGNLIGNSQRYSSEAGMENGIKNLKNRISSISK